MSASLAWLITFSCIVSPAFCFLSLNGDHRFFLWFLRLRRPLDRPSFHGQSMPRYIPVRVQSPLQRIPPHLAAPSDTEAGRQDTPAIAAASGSSGWGEKSPIGAVGLSVPCAGA